MPDVIDPTVPPVPPAPAPVPLLKTLAADLDEAQRAERVLRRAVEDPRAAPTWDAVHRAARRRQQLQDELDQMRRGLAQCLATLPDLQRHLVVARSGLAALVEAHRGAEAKARAQVQQAQQAVDAMRRHIAALAGADLVPGEG
jgi:hypothetical protein